MQTPPNEIQLFGEIVRTITELIAEFVKTGNYIEHTQANSISFISFKNYVYQFKIYFPYFIFNNPYFEFRNTKR